MRRHVPAVQRRVRHGSGLSAGPDLAELPLHGATVKHGADSPSRPRLRLELSALLTYAHVRARRAQIPVTRHAKRLAAALAAVEQYLEQEHGALSAVVPAVRAQSQWALAGRIEQMSVRARMQAGGRR